MLSVIIAVQYYNINTTKTIINYNDNDNTNYNNITILQQLQHYNVTMIMILASPLVRASNVRGLFGITI